MQRPWLNLSLMVRIIIPLLAMAAGCLPAMAATPATAKTDAHLAATTDCAALLGVDFSRDPEAPIALLSAKVVAASGKTPEYCAVTGYVQPQIQFEVRLPTTSWNGRYFQIGCGGFCGFVNIAGCGDVLAQDFVVAADNMGHVGNILKEPLWGSDPAARRDYGARSTHATAVAAKRITAAFYGLRPAYSYFRGCSTGGREGLMEAQHQPGDFDGIVAGDPAFAGRLGAIANVWDAQHLFKPDNSLVVSKPMIAFLHDAVIKACDGIDGVKDGIIADPRRCRFDVGTLGCKDGGEGSDCFSRAQLVAIKAVYDGPRDSKNRRLFPGGSVFGSEGSWAGDDRMTLSEGALRFLMFPENPPLSYTYRDFDFDRDLGKVEAQVALYDPVAPHTAPDLSAFQKRGGRLILYHGWADQGVSPLGTLDYYAQVHSRQGGLAKTRDWFRLFMVPGMYHCRGGNAPNSFDFMPAIIAWVEHGIAPDGVVATQKDGDKIVRTRPLYAYPAYAEYDGKGDVDAAASWHPATPKVVGDDRIDWEWGPRSH